MKENQRFNVFDRNILKSYNSKGIYSIILKFVEMIATCITNKIVSGNFLILKNFTLIAIPVHLLWVSLCRFTVF